MAAVSNLITLGIGSPAEIDHLILFGLNPAAGAMSADHWQVNTGGVLAIADVNTGGVLAIADANTGGVLAIADVNTGGVLDIDDVNTGGISVGS